MEAFKTFFEIGWKHIADIHAYDHLLFILSLILAYSIADIKKVLLLFSAFTVGHGISMVLGYFDLIPLSSAWIEFLIPITIIIMSLYHLLVGKGKSSIAWSLALIFGAIHGMAYIKEFLIMMRSSEDILMPILGFNLGVEVAQIIFGLMALILIYLLVLTQVVQRRPLNIFIFGVILTLAVQLAMSNNLW